MIWDVGNVVIMSGVDGEIFIINNNTMDCHRGGSAMPRFTNSGEDDDDEVVVIIIIMMLMRLLM